MPYFTALVIQSCVQTRTRKYCCWLHLNAYCDLILTIQLSWFLIQLYWFLCRNPHLIKDQHNIRILVSMAAFSLFSRKLVQSICCLLSLSQSLWTQDRWWGTKWAVLCQVFEDWGVGSTETHTTGRTWVCIHRALLASAADYDSRVIRSRSLDTEYKENIDESAFLAIHISSYTMCTGRLQGPSLWNQTSKGCNRTDNAHTCGTHSWVMALYEGCSI